MATTFDANSIAPSDNPAIAGEVAPCPDGEQRTEQNWILREGSTSGVGFVVLGPIGQRLSEASDAIYEELVTERTWPGGF